MEKKSLLLNTLLAIVLGVGLLIGMLQKTFFSSMILANLDIPSMVALVLIALLIEYFCAGTQKRVWPVQILLAAVTFALLPWAADLPYADVKLAIVGTVIFALVTVLFDFAAERIELTTNCKWAIVPTAFGFFLTSQIFMGMIL